MTSITSSPDAYRHASTNDSGRFEFPDVHSGTYTLSTSLTPELTETVVVNGVPVDDLVVNVPTTFHLEVTAKATPSPPFPGLESLNTPLSGLLFGEILDAEGNALDFAPFRAYLISLGARGFSSGASIPATISKGTLTIPLIEGRWLVYFYNLAPGYSLRSLSYGSADLLKDDLVIQNASAISRVRVVLTK